MTIAVTQRGYDNARTMCNPNETVLTAAAVKACGLKVLFKHVLPGDLRGTEGTELVAPSVKVPDGRTLDLSVYGTQGNLVLAFDRATEDMVWSYDAGGPVNNSAALDMTYNPETGGVNDHWGVCGTGVLNIAAGVGYWCAWSSPDGTAANATHSLHAVNLADGTAHHAPVSLEGVTYTGPSGVKQTFVGAMRKQRGALGLVDGIVNIPFGSVSETAHSARGWLICFDTRTGKLSHAWVATSSKDGWGGGLWNGGGGLSADSAGRLYFVSSNGTWDGAQDFSETAGQLTLQAPAANAGPKAIGTLVVTDHITLWTDGQREGLLATNADDVPTPTNDRTYIQAVSKGWNDADVGSGSGLLDEDRGVLYFMGKDSVLFGAWTAKMGGTKPADLATVAGVRANYKRLAFPPIFGGYYPPTLNPAPDDIATLNTLYGGYTHHQHGEMVLTKLTDAKYLWCHCENGNLRMWDITASSQPEYVACSDEWASANCAGPPGGMPGGMISASWNGTDPTSLLIWDILPLGDSNTEVTDGRLLVYAPRLSGGIATRGDGSKQLVPIFDSLEAGMAFKMNKFGRGVPANGLFSLPTFQAEQWFVGLA